MTNTIKERFGAHILTIDYKGDDFAQVTVEDYASFKFPVMFSTPMSYAQANAYLDIFKAIGFVDVINTAF